MDAELVEGVQELHEVVDVHRPGSLLLEVYAGEHLLHQALDVEVIRYEGVVLAAVDLVVLLHQQEGAGLTERCTQGLILSDKAYSGDKAYSVSVPGQRYEDQKEEMTYVVTPEHSQGEQGGRRHQEYREYREHIPLNLDIHKLV